MKYNIKQKCLGFGLPELLIGIFFSSLIMILVMQRYLLVVREDHLLQKQVGEFHDLVTIRELMRHSVQLSGFTPCLNLKYLRTENPQPNLEVIGKTNSIIHVQRMSSHFEQIVNVLQSTQVAVPSSNLFSPLQKVLISDCFHAEVKVIKRVTSIADGELISFTQPLHYRYHSPIYLGEWIQEAFFVKKMLRNKSNSNRLFYRRERIDELSTSIQDLVAKIRCIKQNCWCDIGLKLLDNSQQELSIRVRS